jgi:hypothetical protein
VVGGYNGDGILNDAELYDPETGKWSATGSREDADIYLTATLLRSGKVLAVWGNRAALYDPDTGTWTNTLGPSIARHNHTATLLEDGSVLVASGEGGVGGNQPNSAEVYNPDTSTWSETGNLSFTRGRHTATLLPGGEVLIIGGRGAAGTVLSLGEMYDPDTNAWSSSSQINEPRTEHTATMLPDGTILVAGGHSEDGVLSSAEVYDQGGPMPSPAITGASVAGKKLFVSGENFSRRAVILLNGEEQITKNDSGNPRTILIGKKAGKMIKPGDTLQVRNSDGTLSQEFTFSGN